MKTLVKIAPLVLLLFSSFIFVSAEAVTSTVPYDFPGGFVNDIRTLYTVEDGFVETQVQKFPEYYYNYTVGVVGWLEISIGNQTGARPVIQVNGESVYAQMDTFYREKVVPGDFIEVKMVPPRVLESSHDMVQNNEIITRFKLYSWDDMSGELLFTFIPRSEIIPDFTFSPETPVEDGTLKFTASGVTDDIGLILWDLLGSGLVDDGRGDRYLSPRLEAGAYNVTVTFIDVFGYSANTTKPVIVESGIQVEEPDSEFTRLIVSDVSAPGSSLIGERFDIDFSLDIHISGPREIRLRVVDVDSGTVLSIQEDLLDANGSKPYQLSLIASPIPRPMILRVDVYYLDSGLWVLSGSSPVFTLDLSAPEQDNSIPGFPMLGVFMGLIGLVLLKRKSLVRVIP